MQNSFKQIGEDEEGIDERFYKFVDSETLEEFMIQGADNMIKGIEKLSNEQIEHIEKVNKLHTEAVGTDYKEGMKIIEVWLDENNVTCVRLKNGDWYHYAKDGTWF